MAKMNNRENKKLRVLLSLLVFVMVLSLFSGLALAVGPIEVELGTVSPTYAGDSIVLTLTNNTASVITVEAPYRVKVDDYDIANVDPSWILFTGELAAGETKEIATIPSGEGWQNFWGKSGYGPPQTSYYSIQAWLIVNGVEWESAIFTHTVEPPPPCEEGEVCASGTT
ncbi:MAG: hypothetical protein NUK65_09025, partial [Firmicutes bacterium]|nr:hypothetical protein [Bacillota bacterium]